MRSIYFDLDGYRLNARGLDRARGLVGNLRFPARPCVLGRSGNPAAAAAAERRSEVSRYEAANIGGEALQRSTRSPGGGAWRRSAGMRPYSLKAFCGDHMKRYKKRPIYLLITSPKGTLQALIYLHRYNRDTVNRFPGGYLRPYRQKLEAKRVSAEHILTGGGSDS